MSSVSQIGADAVTKALLDAGIDTVFGIPGTQNIPLFDAFRRNGIKTILATSEAMAGFMAIGWHRAGGGPGVFAAIPGPGFAFALAPLAEAALDSSSILLITGLQTVRGKLFDHQAIDQTGIAESICPGSLTVEDAGAIYDTVRRSIARATTFGSRPIVLQVDSAALAGDWQRDGATNDDTSVASNACSLPGSLASMLQKCRKPLIIAGSGALSCADEVQNFASECGALVCTTPAARGIMSEDDWRVLPVDFLCDDVEAFNRLSEECDLILALGCRFSHNGSGGYSMLMPKDALVHVHEDSTVLNANYEAKWTMPNAVSEFLSAASDVIKEASRDSSSDWTQKEAIRLRGDLVSRLADEYLEPTWSETGEPGCEALFDELRKGMPDDGILVTDTGMHQILARKYFEVRAPRGLIVPTDFQSMGFGVPAAIGAALACPERRVVALVGDGTFLMTLSELVTIAREQIPLVVVVFADGWLGQIRMQQVEYGAAEFSTKLHSIDLESLCKSVGVHYERGRRNLGDQVKTCLKQHKPAILEIKMGDPLRLESLKNRMRRKERLKSMLGPTATRLVKKLTGRSS